MELIIDPVSTIAFEAEKDERGIMSRPPRNPNTSFFGPARIWFSSFTGLLLLIMVTVVYFLSLREGHTEGEVRAIAFSTLIIGNVFLILTDLSKTRHFLYVFKERNYAAIIILLSAVVLLMMIISIPGLQSIFSFEFPGFGHFIPALIATGLLLLVMELIKYFRVRAR
jgi:Ca2+-transporting ATPase